MCTAGIVAYFRFSELSLNHNHKAKAEFRVQRTLWKDVLEQKPCQVSQQESFL
jgi:hypothetical protein